MATRAFIMLELQRAVHSALTGDATLMAMVTGIFDADMVPTGQPFPYISYGSHTDGPWPQFQQTNATGLFNLSIWSRVSREELYAIQAEVRRLLENNPDFPALPSYGLSILRYDWSADTYDKDTGIWHLPTRFRVIAVEL